MSAESLAALQAHVAALRAALEGVANAGVIEYPCPNAGNPAYDADYGLGYGHICDVCGNTGTIVIDVLSSARAALAATPEQSLDALRNEAAAEALERMADYARTKRDEHHIRGDVYAAPVFGVMYAHLTIEAIRLRETANG